MMDIHYLTDNIFIQDSKMLYHTNNKSKAIQSHNWHIHLQEYGWSKLPSKLITLLNKQLKTPSKNSPFGCLDCGGDGDCLFHCISHSLNNNYQDMDFKNYTSYEIRKLISENITNEQYSEIIDYYRILKDCHEFEELWDPHSIHSKEDFCDELMKESNNYWGDFLLLQLLSPILQINCLILSSDSTTNKYSTYPTMLEYNPNYKTIILLYEDNIHFKLVGYFKDSLMNYLFTHEKIPIEISKIFTIYR